MCTSRAYYHTAVPINLLVVFNFFFFLPILFSHFPSQPSTRNILFYFSPPSPSQMCCPGVPQENIPFMQYCLGIAKLALVGQFDYLVGGVGDRNCVCLSPSLLFFIRSVYFVTRSACEAVALKDSDFFLKACIDYITAETIDSSSMNHGENSNV